MYQNIYYERKNNTLHIWDDKLGHIKKHYHPYGFVLSDHGEFRTIFGDPVVRVDNVDQFHQNELFESDIKPEVRYLVDEYLDDNTPSKHRLSILDIEVEKTDKFASPKTAENRITSICAWDNIDRIYRIWVLSDTLKSTETIFVFSDEKELLKSFLQYWSKLSPTLISGWNIDYFDIPYLYNRLNLVLGNGQGKQLSPIKICEFDKNKERVSIAGVTALDYLYLYKKFTFSEEPRYTLDWISKKELGRGKIEYKGSLQELYENDINTFIEYNKIDVDLVVALDEKLRFIDLVLALAHECHVPYGYVWHTSYYLDGAILTYCRKNKLVVPNAAHNRSSSPIPGAYVKEPKAGLYDWVYDLDLKSLYPSIIQTLNISPETKMGKVLNWDGEKYVTGKLPQLDIEFGNGQRNSFSSDDFAKFLEEYKCTIAANGMMYRTDKLGLIPSILTDWLKERDESKTAMKKYKAEGNKEKTQFYNTRQLVKKTQANSLYGVLLLMSFRFADRDNGEAITLTGQSVITFSSRVANQVYGKILGKEKDYCIYTDTDSVFYSAKPIIEHRYPNLDFDDVSAVVPKVLETASEIQYAINRSYDIYAKRFHNTTNHKFSIKQEVVASKGLWLGVKKRYAQWVVNEEGVEVNKLDVKGMDVVRSSFPAAFREFMKTCLIDILKGRPKSYLDDEILKFKELLNTADVKSIMIPTGVKDLNKYNLKGDRKLFKFVKGTPAHVKAALSYNDMLKYFKQPNLQKLADGDKILWAYLKNNELGLESCAISNDEDNEQVLAFITKYIDRNKIFESLFHNKLQDFYSALNWGDLILNAHVNSFFEF